MFSKEYPQMPSRLRKETVIVLPVESETTRSTFSKGVCFAMIRDPFYRDILNRLNHPLDPDLFEQCVADLLRDDWPTLVPIRGGGDAGMDGGLSDFLCVRRVSFTPHSD
jgi:hypothetical protein